MTFYSYRSIGNIICHAKTDTIIFLSKVPWLILFYVVSTLLLTEKGH